MLVEAAAAPALERKEKKYKYINFAEGKVVVTTPEGKKCYAAVSGRIKDIFLTERVIGGSPQKYWYLILEDEGEAYKVGFYYENSGYKAVVMSLIDSGVTSGDVVTFTPSLSGRYTNIDLALNGKPLRWNTTYTLPPLEEVAVGGRVYKDSARRMEFIEALTREIVAGLKKPAA